MKKPTPEAVDAAEKLVAHYDLFLYGSCMKPKRAVEFLGSLSGWDLHGIGLRRIAKKVCRFWCSDSRGDRRRARKASFDSKEWERMQAWIRAHKHEIAPIDTPASVARRMMHSGVLCSTKSVRTILGMEGLHLPDTPPCPKEITKLGVKVAAVLDELKAA